MKYPQDIDKGVINILGDLNQKKTEDPRVQAIFRR